MLRTNFRHALITSALAMLIPAASGQAQVFPHAEVLRISVAPRILDGTSNTIATNGRARDGSVALVVRSFDRRTGFQQGASLVFLDVRFADILVSANFEPGRVLVLDSDRRVHVFPLSYASNGTRFLGPPGASSVRSGMRTTATAPCSAKRRTWRIQTIRFLRSGRHRPGHRDHARA